MAELKKGFIRTVPSTTQGVAPEQRALLLRKGNELFNAGKHDMAEKIFTTLKYTDGLVRVGDLYWKQGNYTKAAELYQKAPDPARLSRACERMAAVIRQLMKETVQSNGT